MIPPPLQVPSLFTFPQFVTVPVSHSLLILYFNLIFNPFGIFGYLIK